MLPQCVCFLGATAAGAALHLPDVCSYHLLQVNSVPPGRLLWQLTWDQMLSAELAYHRQQPGAPPDGVIVHRKNRSEDGDVLVHDVRCNPNNNQVSLQVWFCQVLWDVWVSLSSRCAVCQDFCVMPRGQAGASGSVSVRVNHHIYLNRWAPLFGQLRGCQAW